MNASKVIPWIPVVGQLWWLGEKIAQRVRARRARRRGEPVCDDVASPQEIADGAQKAYEMGRDARRKTRGK